MGRKFFQDCPIPENECNQCKRKESCQDELAYLILGDCKSFYYVYCWLNQENKIPIAHNSQENFDAEIEHYLEKCMSRPVLSFTEYTNGAFAAELALKFLFAREHQSYAKLHDLAELFHYLPTIHKTELLHRLKTQAHQSEKTIEDQLPGFSNAFVKSRYYYEYGSFGLTGLFAPFVKIVCEYALEFDETDDDELEVW